MTNNIKTIEKVEWEYEYIHQGNGKSIWVNAGDESGAKCAVRYRFETSGRVRSRKVVTVVAEDEWEVKDIGSWHKPEYRRFKEVV